jgi:hypothetical protein
MSASEITTLNEENRQRMAVEVLELGQSLFETALKSVMNFRGNEPLQGQNDEA